MNKIKRVFLGCLLFFTNGLLAQNEESNRLVQNKPNIIFILADDMGIGDVSGLNPASKIKTPNLDLLLESGLNFTDAHTTSSVCTPTRYGIITGQYPWRTKLKSFVLNGYSKSMIEDNTDTTPSLLKRNGYNTAMIGKWHLGWNWEINGEELYVNTANRPYNLDNATINNIDYSKPFSKGPTDVGFDYFYGINASLDFPPYTYSENNKATVLPTTNQQFQGRRKDFPGGKKKDFEGGQVMMRSGPKAENFDAEQVLLTLTTQTVDYIKNYNSSKPFFLYVPLTSPHTPVLPRKKFVGTSEAGAYGDFIQETDWSVGEILKILKKKGFDENTLVIFSADNGASKASFPIEYESKYGHKPSGNLSGRKGSLNEGGHRVPFIVKWPNKIAPKSENNTPICLNDLYATCAAIVNEAPLENQGVDSFSILNLMLGKTNYNRESTIYTDIAGRFAIRKGAYKLILNPSKSHRALYNLNTDISELNNLYDLPEFKEIQDTLLQELTNVIKNGRSTEGKKLKNDGQEIWDQLYWLK